MLKIEVESLQNAKNLKVFNNCFNLVLSIETLNKYVVVDLCIILPTDLSLEEVMRTEHEQCILINEHLFNPPPPYFKNVNPSR